MSVSDSRMDLASKQVIFFDGVCNLCNGFVDFLIRRDQKGLFQYAPLQGETAKKLLPALVTEKLNSVVLWREGHLYKKSDAALMVLQQLGGLWAGMKIFWLLPSFFRDWAYDLVAMNRYRLFGRRETCRLPTPEERKQFLD